MHYPASPATLPTKGNPRLEIICQPIGRLLSFDQLDTVTIQIPRLDHEAIAAAETAHKVPCHAPGSRPEIQDFQMTQTHTGTTPEPAAALRLSQVTKAFGATEIIRGVDWTIQQGECHVLIGPNGAGKSTLFHLISGRYLVSGGTIHLNDVDVTRFGANRISRNGLGRSFQTANLFGRMSVFENARIGALRAVGLGPSFLRILRRDDAASLRALEILDEVGLLDQRNEPAALLSYADQRALEIALALAGGQKVLLFDEPTAGMNKQETHHVIALLQRLRAADSARTLVIIEHDMDVVFELADRISVLVYGEMIACDTPQRVRANRAVQEAYLGTPATAAAAATPTQRH
jgi:branched-chain amino acid transport system ATP-binding protein